MKPIDYYTLGKGLLDQPWIGTVLVALLGYLGVRSTQKTARAVANDQATAQAALASAQHTRQLDAANDQHIKALEKDNRAHATRVADERRKERLDTLIEVAGLLFDFQIAASAAAAYLEAFDRKEVDVKDVNQYSQKRNELANQIITKSERYGYVPEGLGAEERMFVAVIEVVINYTIRRLTDPADVAAHISTSLNPVRQLLAYERGEQVGTSFAAFFCRRPLQWVCEQIETRNADLESFKRSG